MKGVVFTGDSTLELMDFADPAPGPADVVVEIKASGQCGGDFKLYRPPAGAAFAALGLKSDGRPIIAGHEPCRVIAAVGKDVSPRAARVGDRVLVHHYSGCTTCPHCRTGWIQMCEAGAAVYGVTAHGGHASYMMVPASSVMPLPAELSFSAGAAISCGTGTDFVALVRLGLTTRDTVAIFGQGPVGLPATQLAHAMGARVIAVDISADRAARATARSTSRPAPGPATSPGQPARPIPCTGPTTPMP